ncbi:uncharacterized protein TNCV_2213791 [Trichonephila clavipes]|nr:uncharacterized protein TNCV_2213791 [Trichonephila clavipes]
MPLRRFRRQYEQLSQFERGRILCMMEAGWSARPVARQLGRSDCVNQVIFSDESRYNLNSDDNRVRVWRPRGERLIPAFALQLHTTPKAGVMVWGAIAFNTRSPVVLIRGTMTAQRYVHDIVQPHVFPLMQRLPGTIFQHDNAQPHTARVSQDCLRIITPFLGLPDPQICKQSSISEIIWDGELGNPEFERTRGKVAANME